MESHERTAITSKGFQIFKKNFALGKIEVNFIKNNPEKPSPVSLILFYALNIREYK